jgi:hypothetical protein
VEMYRKFARIGYNYKYAQDNRPLTGENQPCLTG